MNTSDHSDGGSVLEDLAELAWHFLWPLIWIRGLLEFVLFAGLLPWKVSAAALALWIALELAGGIGR